MERKLFQKDVARLLGVNTDTVTNWERNRITPDLRCIPKFIEFLGYTPWDGKVRGPGKRLKAYRWSRGISQKEMAGLLGIDPGTLARRERGGNINLGGKATKDQKVS